VDTALPGVTQFPFDTTGQRSAFNEVVLHPRILRAVAQLLDEADVRFYGDLVQAKYGTEPASGDQNLHLDFGNNTLLVPPPLPARPETVNCILTYTGPGQDGVDGATRFVPDGLCNVTHDSSGALALTPETHSSLYERERAVEYSAGTVLLYRLDVLHRGCPVLPGKMRVTHHTNYRRADCEWVGSKAWAHKLWTLERHGMLAGEEGSRSEFLAGLGPEQRRALGYGDEAEGARL
jgi:hypothetical protein